MIFDGFGINPRRDHNAVALARTPHYDAVRAAYPVTSLIAMGEDVGLPPGLMGNSEVGHMNMGAGRVVWQEISRIDKSIREGSFFRNEVLTGLMIRAIEQGSALHLLGLVSDGGVHSSDRHLQALVELARREGLRPDRVFVHAFTDGRDTPPQSGRGHLGALRGFLERTGVGRIATVCGRYYAMDRDRRWDRTERAYRAIREGRGGTAPTPEAAIEAAYAAGETDEFVTPRVIVDGAGAPVGRLADGDAVFFFNFRADRARQLTRALMDPDFQGFDRGPAPPRTLFASMTRYEKDFPLPHAFAPQSLERGFPEVVAAAGLRQLRIAETEKYAHVTYFFNGGEERPFPGEERILVPSPKVATYDLRPEMSAPEVTERVLATLAAGAADAIILNFANPDMVGHTGKLDAAIRAVETVDASLGRIREEALRLGGAILLTADHGNCEQMIDYATGAPHTYHTTNPVPFVAIGESFRGARLRKGGRLCDLAPTMLKVLGLAQPAEMTGESLV